MIEYKDPRHLSPAPAPPSPTFFMNTESDPKERDYTRMLLSEAFLSVCHGRVIDKSVQMSIRNNNKIFVWSGDIARA